MDLGITGADQVAEHDAGVRSLGRRQAASGESTPTETREKGCEAILDLDFGACKLEVQVPVEGQYKTPADLIGRNIGTSLVHLAEDYFTRLEAEAAAAAGEKGGDKKLKTNIVELSGSVEAACALGVADGIVDLVESGETMKAAGLKAIDTVVSSTAIMIKSKKPSNPTLVELIASRIRGVISKFFTNSHTTTLLTQCQLPKSTCCASTTSTARTSRPSPRSRLGSARRRSTRWRTRAGWPSARWWRRRGSRLSWTS